jgi:hypothetical protein
MAPSQAAADSFAANVLITAKNIQVRDHLRNLYAHLLENHYIDSIVGFDRQFLAIFSRDVLRRIKETQTLADTTRKLLSVQKRQHEPPWPRGSPKISSKPLPLRAWINFGVDRPPVRLTLFVPLCAYLVPGVC